MSARAWGLAGVASVLLHGAGLAGIALATKPDPAPEQEVPESRFTIEAAEVARSRAEPEAPQSEAVAETDAPATAAQSGAVPQSRAEAAMPVTQAVAAARPPTSVLSPQTDVAPTSAPIAPRKNRLSADTLQTDRLDAEPGIAPVLAALGATVPASAALSPVTDALVTVTPTAQTTTVLSPALDRIVSQAAPATLAIALPASAPKQDAVVPEVAALGAQVASAPVATPISAAAPAQAAVAAPSEAAAPASPDTTQAGALPLPATPGTAALAWSGSEDAPVSATSLAAIAAFTRAGDLATEAAQVRDGIAGLLASVPCARLQTTFIPETGQLELRGHVPEDALRGPVLAALREQVGDAIPLSDQVLILPRPQCGALAGIASLGLPQSAEQLTNPAVIGEDGFARNTTYLEGERFYLEMTGADYDAFLYVDYFDKDGNVIHLQPNEFVPLERVAADAEVLVAKSEDGRPALELTISAPFGQEIAAAFAASHPLYDGVRPLVEPADEYLAFLKDRVAQVRAEEAGFKGEWVYFFITTRGR